jgi:hypothetical protein
MFKQDTTSLPVFIKEKSFQNATNHGKIDPAAQGKVKTFLLDREHQLEFEPKKLTEEQQTKITDITNYLTGKSSNCLQKSLNQHQKILSSKTTSQHQLQALSLPLRTVAKMKKISSLTFNSQVVNR